MSNRPNSAIIVGGGVIGLFSALEILKGGVDVTILEAEPADGNNCSLGNAGMIVPSHFIPLAAPGVLSKGLRWMLDRESPFYVKPPHLPGTRTLGMVVLSPCQRPPCGGLT